MQIRMNVLVAATAVMGMVAFAQYPNGPDPQYPNQPGMGQPGMGQPGMGQPTGQPGMDQPGPNQPGMNQAGNDQEDPPSRAARLGFLQGTVSFQPGGVEDWVPATLNRPMTTGDRLWTEQGSRAEVNLGSAAMRLNGRTNFTFLNLDDQGVQIQLSVGTLSVRLRHLDPQEGFEIDTPQVAFALLQPGDYRVDVNEQGDATILSVRGGEGDAVAGGQTFSVHARDQVRVMASAGGDQPVFDRRPVPPADAFDNWAMDRDRREDMSQSARYVSRDMPGYADLDQNGVWSEDPGIGPIWRPSHVEVGWAPYHYGHWAWIEPWGWTWVDDAPWGYAPFHYGRWAYVGGGWGWVPGPMGVRPVYAPALVAWVGGPSFGVGLAIGGPAVGWFPLGPREVFVPGYRYGPRYIERVNVTNTVIVNRGVFANVNVANARYANRGVAGAVVVVPQGALASGRPIGREAIRVPPGSIERAEVRTYAAAAPERSAVFGGRAVTNAAPPAAYANRQFVARNTPPPPPASFDRQQSALRSNPGRPLDLNQTRQIQQGQPMQERRMVRAGGAQSSPQGMGQQGSGSRTFGSGGNASGNGQVNNGQGNGTGQNNGRGFQRGNPNFSPSPGGVQNNTQQSNPQYNNQQQGNPRVFEPRGTSTGVPPSGNTAQPSPNATPRVQPVPENRTNTRERRNEQKGEKKAPKREEKRDER